MSSPTRRGRSQPWRFAAAASGRPTRPATFRFHGCARPRASLRPRGAERLLCAARDHLWPHPHSSSRSPVRGSVAVRQVGGEESFAPLLSRSSPCFPWSGDVEAARVSVRVRLAHQHHASVGSARRRRGRAATPAPFTTRVLPLYLRPESVPLSFVPAPRARLLHRLATSVLAWPCRRTIRGSTCAEPVFDGPRAVPGGAIRQPSLVGDVHRLFLRLHVPTPPRTPAISRPQSVASGIAAPGLCAAPGAGVEQRDQRAGIARSLSVSYSTAS